MTSTIRFGRIAGVEIGTHWTWLLVVALVVWSLAGGVFPSQNPVLAPAAYLAMAVVAAVLFVASLLAHELGPGATVWASTASPSGSSAAWPG